MADGQLSCGNDVGGRSIHDHDTSLGSGLDVYVVQTNASTGDDLEVLGCSNGLSIYLSGRANQDCIYIGNGFEKLRAVRTVSLTNFKVGAEGSNCRWGKLFGQKYDGLVVRHGCGTFAIS